MITIGIFELTGNFAENKDVAKEIRLNTLIPAIEKGGEVIIDFNGVESATQSFIHALISDVIRKYSIGVLDRIYFRNCSGTVKKIINIVIEYMQQN